MLQRREQWLIAWLECWRRGEVSASEVAKQVSSLQADILELRARLDGTR